MVTWIVILSFNAIHRDLSLEICLVEVLIAGVVGNVVVHMSNLVKLTVLIEVFLTTVHLIDLSCLYRDMLNWHRVARCVQTTTHLIVRLDTSHHYLLLQLLLFM